MDNKYKQLFTELLHTTEILAEKVMDYDKAKEDNKGFEAAQSMRDGYAELADNMNDENYVLTKADYARIAVSVLMIISNIESRIKSQQTALTNYKTTILPRLQRILSEAETDEAAAKLGDELFTIQDEEKSET